MAKADSTTKQRQRRDPKARAEQALAVSERKVTNLGKKLEKAQADVDSLTAEYNEAVRERDYLAQNPALAEPVVQDTPAEQPTA